MKIIVDRLPENARRCPFSKDIGHGIKLQCKLSYCAAVYFSEHTCCLEYGEECPHLKCSRPINAADIGE